ncbi:MAG: nitroreductase family protein [Clostridiales bacterium]|nr:nitroreductase family protein [Clostridiales bacterium]
MNMNFKEAMEARRTYYGISNESPIADDNIIEIVKNSVKNVPTAFNSQSTRVVVLFNENHKKLWDITKEVLGALVPKENFKSTEDKINSFRAGHGTILYFDDTRVTNGLKEQFPLYKDNFDPWADQANGMLQFAIWTQLEAEGLGVNLQHYNPLIDEKVKVEFNIPKEWRLISEMPFGKIVKDPDEKSFVNINERVKVIN